MEAPTFLNSALHRNWAYHVFKHLTPHESAIDGITMGEGEETKEGKE